MFVLNHKKENPKNNILAKKVAILQNLQHIKQIKNENVIKTHNQLLTHENNNQSFNNIESISNNSKLSEENVDDVTKDETENRIVLHKSLYNNIIINNNNDIKNFIKNDIKNFIKNDINFYINNNINLKKIKYMKDSLEDQEPLQESLQGPLLELPQESLLEPPQESLQEPMNYQEKMNNIQMLINKIINNSELNDPYIFKKFILDD